MEVVALVEGSILVYVGNFKCIKDHLLYFIVASGCLSVDEDARIIDSIDRISILDIGPQIIIP